MEKYLVEDLGVPKDRIQRLLGPMGQKTADSSTSPTRANIIKTLYSLIDNPDIMRGDNIVIYFAGNGTLYDAQEYYRDKVPPEVSIASMRRYVPWITEPQRIQGPKSLTSVTEKLTPKSLSKRATRSRSSWIAITCVRESDTPLHLEHAAHFALWPRSHVIRLNLCSKVRISA